MIDIQTIVVFLLIARATSVIFIGIVLRLQWRIFGTDIDFSLVPNLSNMQKSRVYLARKVLFAISVCIFLGNMVPILIDALTIISENAYARPSTLQLISIAYASSNALTAMFSAIMIWGLYRIAGLTGDDDKRS